MAVEEWRVVPDFPLYELNNLGELRRISDGLMMVLGRHRNSYSYTIQGKWKYTMRSAPRLLRSTFPELMVEREYDRNGRSLERNTNA